MLKMLPRDDFERGILDRKNTMSEETKISMIVTHRKAQATIDRIDRFFEKQDRERYLRERALA